MGSCRTRETLVVIAFTVIGGLLRLWSVSRLGLSHFDEGIYATSGLWIFSRNGIFDLDPSLIPYAPPGFPFLIGAAYFVLGASDLSAILVSIVLGTLTIPAVAWLASRTFGSGAGGVAAAFFALSGAHVAFSRMALTDVSFLLVWVLALVQGQRFLEKPCAFRAVLLGVAVGAAQLFKYNGWLAGATVVLSAAAWLALHPGQWWSRHTAATWGWGLLAASVATLVYWPWFAFVQTHGGYAALLAHERGYLGGFASWPRYLLAQLAQARALGGGALWLASAGLAAMAAILVIGFERAVRAHASELIAMATLYIAALRVTPDVAWWVPAVWLPVAFRTRKIAPSHSLVLVYSGWLILVLLTPFYHPYARLWLPLHAFECVFLAGYISLLRSLLQATEVQGPDEINAKPLRRKFFSFGSMALIASAIVFSTHLTLAFGLTNRELLGFPPRNPLLPGVLAPNDSLKSASASIATDVPQTVKTLRVLGRPPLAFYVSQSSRQPVEPQSTLSELLRPGDPSTWALLDTAVIPQGEDLAVELKRMSADWVPVRTIPMPLSLPVLLDIDPSVASSQKAGVQVELRLMRPRRAGDLP
jgi:dolichyl-phosphate-mannose-protein mannosyltransferase